METREIAAIQGATPTNGHRRQWRWLSMIAAGSLARDKRNGQLVFVCDDEHSPSKEWDDPSRILDIEPIDPRASHKESHRSECFEADLAEVTEANGADRQAVCAHYDCMIIRNHWTEDTPPERHYRIWVFKEDDVLPHGCNRGISVDWSCCESFRRRSPSRSPTRSGNRACLNGIGRMRTRETKDGRLAETHGA